jgi:DNA (cytosine-5)-methyltransferase 1
LSDFVRDLFESDISVDLFAGGGGASIGTEAALGRAVDIAINHDEVAIAVHRANHPRTAHYTADVFEVRPEAAVRGRKVRHLHASPDCRSFSRAKGSAPRSASVRSLADVVVVWARAVRPDCITLENVPEFIDWGPVDAKGKPVKALKGTDFARWRGELEAIGYVIEHRVLHAHHYGAPTSRKRFFLVARLDGQPIVWPEPTHGPGKRPYRTAASCIDWSIPCPSIFERKRPLAPATLRRIAAGVVRFVLESPRPFVVSIDHQGSARGDRSVDAPLSTISTKARHCLVAPSLTQTGYGERKGQAARVLDLHKPLGTIVGGGQKHALVAAFLAQHYQGQVGHELTKPLPTITAVDHHSLVTATLGRGEHRQQVGAFLTAYYGTEDLGQSVHDPLRTITTRDRFGLVTVMIDGVEHVIVDIGLRMLEPHELLRAQFGRFARKYDLSAATTKKDQVRLIGNSVCPEVQEAVVRANLPRARGTRRAA